MEVERKMLRELQHELDEIKRARDEYGEGWFGEREAIDAYVTNKKFVETVTGMEVATNNWKLSFVFTLDE